MREAGSFHFVTISCVSSFMVPSCDQKTQKAHEYSSHEYLSLSIENDTTIVSNCSRLMFIKLLLGGRIFDFSTSSVDST